MSQQTKSKISELLSLYRCFICGKSQEMDKSTLRTGEVYLTVLIERGTNATVRCNFGVDSTSIVTVEAQHSPYNLVVAER